MTGADEHSGSAQEGGRGAIENCLDVKYFCIDR